MAEAGEGIEDDHSIPDNLRMLRRIPPDWIKDFRPGSDNFLQRKAKDGKGLSVTAWVVAGDLNNVSSEAPNFGVVSVTAGELRAADYKVTKAPLDGNPNHCECYGAPSRSKRKQLSRQARWVLPPAAHDPAHYGELLEF